MKQAAVVQSEEGVPPGTLVFYRDVLEALNSSALRYVVGGGFAFRYYTGITRITKDIDIFIKHADYDRVNEVLSDRGYRTELTHPHWLGKVYSDSDVLDLVFSSGNGVAKVDQAWFDHAEPATLFGIPTALCPVEEMLWSKAFIMERERFDGADIAHLILARGRQLDWARLLRRFGPHWRLLLSHLVLFGFVYPGHRDVIPVSVMDELLDRLNEELHTAPQGERICGGTLLSREQYLNDIAQWGYEDARVAPQGNMTTQDTARWTAAIDHRRH